MYLALSRSPGGQPKLVAVCDDETMASNINDVKAYRYTIKIQMNKIIEAMIDVEGLDIPVSESDESDLGF